MPTKTTRQSRRLTKHFTDEVFPSQSGAKVHIPVWDDTVTFGANLPDWKARLKSGRNASTSMVGNRRTVRVTSGYSEYTTTVNGLKRVMTGQILDQVDKVPGQVTSSTKTIATTAAAVAFSKQFRNKTRNWQSGVFFGEIFEAARLLSSPVKRLRGEVTHLYDDMVSVLRKGHANRRIPRNQRLLKIGQAMADTWLIWAFGVQPTISDANDACESFRAVASAREFETVRTTAIGTYSELVPSLSFTGANVNMSPAGGFDIQYNRTCTDEAEVTYRGAWRNSPASASGELPLPMRFGLDLSSVVPTAWELIPWSFLIDYFSNIGDVLDAWSLMQVDFAWMNKTTRSRRIYQYSDVYPRSVLSPDHLNVIGYGGNAKVVRYDVNRQPTATLWDAAFQVKVPGMGKRWLNMAALLAMRVPPRVG